MGGSDLDLGFQYRREVTGEADADKHCAEFFLRSECANHRFPEFEPLEFFLVASLKKLLHRFAKIGGFELTGGLTFKPLQFSFLSRS